MAFKVGAGSICQAARQAAFGTPVPPDTLLNMTSESIKTSVTKGDEGNLLGSKTANQRDIMAINVDGSISMILRPEFAELIFECGLGKKSGKVFTLADVNALLPCLTLVISRGGLVKTYPDVTINSIKISASAQDYVKVDIDVIGVDEISAGGEGAQVPANLSYTLPSYRCTQASLMFGESGSSPGTALCVESADITISNNLVESPATYCSGLHKGRPQPGTRSVGVSATIPYSDEIDAFRRTYLLNPEGICVALELVFTTSNTDENVQINLPNVSITDADGNVGGSGIIESSISGEALSVGNAEPISIIVNHAE